MKQGPGLKLRPMILFVVDYNRRREGSSVYSFCDQSLSHWLIVFNRDILDEICLLNNYCLISINASCYRLLVLSIATVNAKERVIKF